MQGLEPVASVMKQNRDPLAMDTSNDEDQYEYSEGGLGRRDVVSAPF